MRLTAHVRFGGGRRKRPCLGRDLAGGLPDPKSNGKLRPLGIPTIADRAQQNRVRNALEPQWEARFEARSYGFRPGRGCHDAIEAVFVVARGKTAKRQWVLDLDLRAAFDHINHEFLLQQMDGFPAKEMIRTWLRAGVVEHGQFSPTEEGTPQLDL
jgi:RNA-directed DNA polymerase